MRLLAIDFETADYRSDSACAVGLVRIEDGRTTARIARLIRPPRRRFVFTYIHGITWADVRREPDFAGVWGELEGLLAGCDALVAHNAGFDRAVLHGCCAAYGLEAPSLPFLCTVRLARAAWQIRPTNLPAVCRHLGIPLRHHDAGSDAEAAARIALAALAEGHALEACFLGRRRRPGRW